MRPVPSPRPRLAPRTFAFSPRLSARALSALALAACLAGGCQQDGKKQTPKQLVTQQWNNARAGVLLSLAKEQYEGGAFDKARLSINDAMKLAPQSGPVRVLSAKVAIEQGQLELAEKELNKAREYNPGDAEVEYLGGVVYQRWQKPELAFECYGRAMDKAPSELAYLMAKAEMLVAMDRAPEALALLQERVVYFEHSAAIRDAAGLLLMQAGQRDEAVKMLREASILATDDWSIKEHLALALYRTGQWAECGDLVRRLVKEERYAKRADLYLALGECQQQAGQYRDARDSLMTVTRLDPASPAGWLGLGKAALQVNDLKRAETALTKALLLDAGAEGQLLMGYLRFRQGKSGEALSAFAKAAATAHDDPASAATAWCMSGYVLERLGRGEEALRCYAEALKAKPDDDLANQLMSSVQLNEEP